MTIGADRETGPPAPCPDRPDRRPVLGSIHHGRITPHPAGSPWLVVAAPMPQQVVPKPWPMTPPSRTRDRPSAPMVTKHRFSQQEVIR